LTPPRRWYLTTPIYYASGDPHIGHAYTTILADVLARFARQIGTTVFFLTGTDEHGPKIQDEAERRGIQPLELCDLMAGGFSAAWTKLDISHDRFIRTTEDEHKAVVTAFLQRLWDRGQIYKAAYTGWYCVYEERRRGSGRRRTWALTIPARTAAEASIAWRRPTTSSR